VTAEDLIAHFKVARAQYRQKRRAEEDYDRVYLWDDLKKHVAAFLDDKDPKRQVITDGQLWDAEVPAEREALLAKVAERLHGKS
jgi:hypothetical protein